MRIFFLFAFLSVSAGAFCQNVAWYPLRNENSTTWGEKLDIDNILSEYPRPTLAREHWMNLNGIWNFSITENDTVPPTNFDRQILVPFPAESTLSGINEEITSENRLWYRRNFIIPEEWSYRYILLHIGASDWETKVYVNGEYAGIHRGGYDPISLDITFLLRERGRQQITIEVWDPTNKHYQPHGKQKLNAKGEWHSPVSGIWQTVWIEPVMWASFQDIKVTTDIDKNTVSIDPRTFQAYGEDSVICSVIDKGKVIDQEKKPVENTFEFTLKNPQWWSPEDPHLYQLGLTLIRNGQKIDSVSSYFGMRKITVEKDKEGKKRIFLNNKPYFPLGIVDQGFWPDGLYTAPSDDAILYDLRMAKQMGYNLIRKLAKIEPERWYYHCDQLGILVWQDMPASGVISPDSTSQMETISNQFAYESQLKIEFENIIKTNFNHPSIISWNAFANTQAKIGTDKTTGWIQKLDSTRLISTIRNGEKATQGPVLFQGFPMPNIYYQNPNISTVIGAFGGIYYPLSLHPISHEQASRYIFVDSERDLFQKYQKYLEDSYALINKGISASIYYQLTDVENEVNGLISSDRKEIKISPKKLSKEHQSLIQHFESTVK